MITIVNKRTHLPSDDVDVYIGRGSPLGNPLPIGVDVDREQALLFYEHHLTSKIRDKDEAVRGELNRIWKAAKVGNVNLVCYCAPRRCHGEFIKKLIEEKL